MILTLNMEKNKQHFWYIMVFYFKIKMQKRKESAVNRESTVNILKIKCLDFLLYSTPRLGQIVEFDSNQIKTLLENNQCYDARDWQHAQDIEINH